MRTALTCPPWNYRPPVLEIFMPLSDPGTLCLRHDFTNDHPFRLGLLTVKLDTNF